MDYLKKFFSSLLLTIVFFDGILFSEELSMPNYPYIRYTVDQGLPQSSISYLTQDTYGFVWIATNEGIARFDGNSFKPYTVRNGYPFKLISGLIEYKPGKLLIAGAIHRIWELSNDQVKNIIIDSSLTNSKVNFLAKTYDNEILIGLEPGGLYVLANDTIKLHIKDQNGPLKGAVICAAKDFKGNYWLGTYENGVQVFKDTTKILHLTQKDGLPSNQVRSILPLPTNKVWIGTHAGLFVYGDSHLTRELNQKFSNVFIFYIYTKNYQDIWINFGSRPGGVLHVKDNELKEILHSNEGTFSRTTLIDESGALFIGTYKGLIVLPNRNFENFGKESGLTDTYIRSIAYGPDGHVWVATKNDGIFKIINNNKFIKISVPDSILLGNSIFCLEVIDKKLWLGTSRGIFIYDKGKIISNKFTKFFKGKMVRLIKPIEGIYYFVTKRGIYKIVNKKIIDITYNLKNQNISFWGIAQDKNGKLFVASNGKGIFILKQNKWEPFHAPDSARFFLGVHPDKHKNLFFNSSNHLYKWDGKDFIKIVNTKSTIWDVLPSDKIIWALTSNGLYQIKNGKIRIYNRGNGFITTEFNIGCAFSINDNEAWFGGVDGIVHYKKIEEYPELPQKFYISHIESADSFLSFPYTSKIIFPFSNNSLRFYFTQINYGNGPYFKFGYWLEGFTKDTLILEDEHINYIDYSYLPDGFYTFHLFLYNPFTGEYADQRKVSFTILVPWYKSPIFILSSIFVSMFIVLLIIRARESYLKKRNLLLELQVQERTEDIRQSYKLLKKETEQRKKAQASLKKEREQLEITLKSIADGVVRIDSQGKILLMNQSAEKILGISKVQAQNKFFNELFLLREEANGNIIKLPERLVPTDGKENSSGNFYALLELSHKSTRNLNVSWSIIKGENDQNIGYVLVFRDVSLEKQLEKEILKSQKLESIGLLAGGIAHDFNNILTSILGNAQLVKMKLNGQPDLQHYLDGIEEATLNASHLTKQLLTFAKGGEPVKELLSLKTLLIENVEFALRGSNVTANFNIAPDLWPIEADKGQLNQVINNLVINAAQAMPNGGVLTVIANNCTGEKINKLFSDKPHKHYIQIKIIDTGIGIPKENLTKIFDPYFTTKQRGSGLGLASTYAIIKKHDGWITVESELGKGTTFVIYLPAKPAAIVTEEKKKSEIEALKEKRILVMDDEEYIRELIGSFLDMMGIYCEFAEEGLEAIQKYKKAMSSGKPFDAVIMDLTIRGGMGGKEAVKEILNLNPSAKVIVASGYSTDSLLANYKEHGFIGRLSKPFTLDELNKILIKILKNAN